VVGAEHVSYSAVLTLAQAGAAVVGMTTEWPRHQTFGVVRAGAALRYRVPLWTRTAVAAIHGHPRVEEVELLDVDTGATRRVACDTVVFTADWIADHELAVALGLELDAGTGGPQVDTGLRTTLRGVFAAGNLLHGAEPADVAALSGRRAARSVASWLAAGAWPDRLLPLVCRPPLAWISPSAVSAARDEPPRGRFLLRSEEFLGRARIDIRQGQRELWSGQARHLGPGRSAVLPAGWLEQVDPAGEEVEVSLARG
jgi:hypothetical protein